MTAKLTPTTSKIVSEFKKFKPLVYFVLFLTVYVLVLFFVSRERHPLCANVNTAPNVTDTPEWITVIEDTLHVYSAYLDLRESPAVVKVMALGLQRPAAKSYGVYCQIWMRENGRHWIYVTKGRESPLPVRMGRRYEGVIIHCGLPRNWNAYDPPPFVSLTMKACSQTHRALTIQHRETSFVPKYNFTMCLPPIYNQFSNLGEMLGYIEVNRILGADHFIIYNLSIGEELTPLLKSYTDEGILEVLPWKIPVKHLYGPVPDVHYFGQLVAVNDCLYRSRTNSRHVIFSDMDEVMAPLQHDTWSDLVNEVSAKTNHKISAFVFKNVFFRKAWPKDPNFRDNPINKRYNLFTMTYTKRETYSLQHIHSKVMCDPDGVKVMAVHSTHTLNSGFQNTVVPEDLGLLFHYRSQVYGRLWTFLSKLWGEDKTYLIETRMFHFSKILLANVQYRLNKTGISTMEDRIPSQQGTNATQVKQVTKALNFLLQCHPWGRSVIFE